MHKEDGILHTLSPLEVHSLVKEKLRLKGISLNSKNVSNSSSSTQVLSSWFLFFYVMICNFLKMFNIIDSK